MIAEMTTIQWVTICISAIFMGMSKTGIQGITAVTVPFMAMAFGAKESTGIILPMLCMADVISVAYFRKKADLKTVFRLLPSAVAGFFLAIAVDKQIPAHEFRMLLGATLLLVFMVMVWSDIKGKENRYSHTWWYAVIFGVLGGFVTMIGNAAGPVMAIYLMSMRKSKLEFIGTNAWYFMAINLLKVPLQIFVWNNITWETFQLNLYMLPFLGIGAFLGLSIIGRFSEKTFHRMIQAISLVSVIAMIVK